MLRLWDANVTWPVGLQQLPVLFYKRNAQKIMADATMYRETPDNARTMRRSSHRSGKWTELDARVYEWYLAIYALGHC